MEEESSFVRKRGWGLSTLFIYQIASNLLVVLGLLLMGWKNNSTYPLMPHWGFYYLTLAGFLEMVAFIGLWNWKKRGSYLYFANCFAYTAFALYYSFPLWVFVQTAIEFSLFILLIKSKWKLLE